MLPYFLFRVYRFFKGDSDRAKGAETGPTATTAP